MTRARLLILVLVVAAAVAAFLVLRPATPDPGPQGPAAPPPPPAIPGQKVTFIVASPSDGRLIPDPCSASPSGGLLSLKPFFDAVNDTVEKGTPSVPVFLGDVTDATGPVGLEVAAYTWGELVVASQPAAATAGPGELALGVDFCRNVLANLPLPVLCANAMDADGKPFLRGWALGDAGGSVVLLVATVSQSAQDRVAAAGSGVRLLAPGDAVTSALAAADAEARRLGRPVSARVLFHHGTAEETAALAKTVPGLTAAFSASGGELPPTEPLRDGGVPVYSTGRGLRFGWIVTVEKLEPVRWTLGRIGIQVLARGSPIATEVGGFGDILRERLFPALVGPPDHRADDPRGTYVGASRCATCHSEAADAHAASAHARRPARFPETGLGRPQCLSCHVTAAFVKTGWAGPRDATDLAAVSCEACHGPGAAHSDAPKAGWGAVPLDRCRTCHTPDRRADFDADALWKKWGHGVR